MNSEPGVVGVLGGMGPLATIDFMRKLLDATPATADQEHVPVLVSNIPQVPDRTAAFRGVGPSPLEAMVSSGRRLVAAGAEVLVVPCNTAHLWFDELQDELRLPMLHLVDAAIEEVQSQIGSGGRVGILGTDATLASGLYVNRRPSSGHQLTWLQPTAIEMLELVMPGIEAVKASKLQQAATLLSQAAQALHRRGASVIMLACTEIPVVLGTESAGLPVIDATAALARSAVRWSLGEHRT